jgi:hypothetical protein
MTVDAGGVFWVIRNVGERFSGFSDTLPIIRRELVARAALSGVSFYVVREL